MRVKFYTRLFLTKPKTLFEKRTYYIRKSCWRSYINFIFLLIFLYPSVDYVS
ncbi:hypothetical protein HanIR_Chr13g0664511 [Helianthus annuus]|nr:hypothetical protein HanIR_Chr13g0664511 [Helianthus annuus]